MQTRYPGRIYAMAGCNPYAGDAWLAELERAVVQDGSRRVHHLEHEGHYPTMRSASLFISRQSSTFPYDAPPFSAMARSACANSPDLERRQPFDSCLALARSSLRILSLSGLKFVATHLGAASPTDGRSTIITSCRAGDFYARDQDASACYHHKPSHYMRMIISIRSYHLPAARCAWNRRIDRFVFRHRRAAAHAAEEARLASSRARPLACGSEKCCRNAKRC